MITGQVILKIPEGLLHKKGPRELVVLDKKEYEHELRHRKELEDALFMIQHGEKELREGKTIAARSLQEAMKKYAHKKR